jgi:phosphatidylglycerophosphate synthase
VRTVQSGPTLAMIAQLALLAALSGTVGLGAVGALAGIVCGAVTNGVLSVGLARAGSAVLGPANRVTLARATLVGAISALIVDSFSRPAHVGVLVALAAVALALDAVDGWVARRTNTVSALGSRFDMEVDAFLILMLSISVSRFAGAWVLAIGFARYAMFAAGLALPWLALPVPKRYWRKVVAAVQGIVLTAATAQFLPAPVITIALAAAMALLAESFGRDVWWLWWQPPAALSRTRPAILRPVGAPGTITSRTGGSV